jgi:uridine kinase
MLLIVFGEGALKMASATKSLSQIEGVKPRLVAIVGGTASGKTTLARDLARIGGKEVVAVVPLDAYYRSNSHIPREQRDGINYDHPDAFDVTTAFEQFTTLQRGYGIDMPVYDFCNHTRSAEVVRVEPRPLVLVEGILTLHYPEFAPLWSYSIFVDTPDELRYQRRLARDVKERGRTPESVLMQWQETVHPMHVKFCEPTKLQASEVMYGDGWDDSTVQRLLDRLLA